MGSPSTSRLFGTLEVIRAELIDADRRLVLELHGGELNRHEVGMFMRELQSLQEKMQPVAAIATDLPVMRPLSDAENPGTQSRSEGS